MYICSKCNNLNSEINIIHNSNDEIVCFDCLRKEVNPDVCKCGHCIKDVPCEELIPIYNTGICQNCYDNI
jgi:hypothetical protein